MMQHNIKRRLDKLETIKGNQPLVILANSREDEAEKVQACIDANGREPDRIVKFIAVGRGEDGLWHRFYGGEDLGICESANHR